MALSRILMACRRWNTFAHARNILPTSGQCKPTSTLIPSPPNPSAKEEEEEKWKICAPREEDELVLIVDGAADRVKGRGPAGGAGILFSSYTDSQGMNVRVVHWLFREHLGMKKAHEAEDLALKRGLKLLEETQSWGAVVYSDCKHLVEALRKGGKLESEYKPLIE